MEPEAFQRDEAALDAFLTTHANAYRSGSRPEITRVAAEFTADLGARSGALSSSQRFEATAISVLALDPADTDGEPPLLVALELPAAGWLRLSSSDPLDAATFLSPATHEDLARANLIRFARELVQEANLLAGYATALSMSASA